ncbi:MAG: hypothetical protein IM620_14160, partial [Cytophagales bacterium]|nr:hypothetical protein [Cytophagales bacterium]
MRYTPPNQVSVVFLLAILCGSISSSGQNTLNNLGLTAATPSTVAFSMRQLSSFYAGPAFRLRRSSDSELRDVYFDGSGTISLSSQVSFAGGGPATATTLGTWIGANSGTVAIWYDQSGFGRDASQPTSSSQPRFINAGVIERQNGVPSLYFTGSSFLTHNSFPTTGFSGFSANVVAKWTTVGTGIGNIQTLLDNNHTGAQGFAIQDRPDLTARPITFGIAATPSGALVQDNTFTGNGSSRILTFTANNTTVSGFRDGNALTTASISSTNYINQTRFVIGAWFNNGSIARYTTGNIPEVILFPSTLSNANRITLECNQSAYYGVSPMGATNTEFYIQGTPASSACNTTDEQVVWKNSDLVNTQATGNNLVKVQSNSVWDGGAASWNTVSDNGYFQFTATETNTLRMAGLSTTNTDANYTTIQYAFYLLNNGTVRIFQSGVDIGAFGTYATNDIFKIAVEANVVKYYRNATLLYISAIAPSLPLLVDVSINSTGGTITNAIVSNYNTGTFTATATNAGATPAYQWKLNGVNVGINSPSYANSSLNNNDVVSCVLTYLGVCGTATATSNAITNKAVPAPTSIDFYITGTAAASACNTVDENVAWRITDFRNVQGTGNNLVKINADGSNGGWNGGAASWNTVSNNGYFQFTATETNTLRMVGLSNTNTDANYTTIQYAFYL